ncbi:ammonia monooxygenase [Actibacterium pelagium]|uniref:Ammonia monooxygenase n=2 Tax=Actibacterium pelagium TaxID=2029103 RepID=A0A917ADR8_9RHOB|nr:ammonia monooxygenase [Actibacterium pelagium]
MACLLAALFGIHVVGSGQIGVVMRTILGVAIGASITPELIQRLPLMTVSLAMVPLYVLVVAVIGFQFFRRVYGLDKATAFFAAMPGGLQEMTAFGEESGAKVRTLTLIHATRLLVIVLVVPLIMVAGFGADLDNPIGAPAATIPIHEMLIMVAAALIGWQLFKRIGMFGAAIIGPMVLSAALSLGDVIHSRPPAEAILAAQFFIGMGLGAGYVGVTLSEIRKDVVAGLAYVIIVAAVAALFAEIVILAGLAPALDGFLAFAPAGQAEMAILAIVVGADLGFVVLHHVTRVFFILTCSPLAARLLGFNAGKDGT